MDKEWKKENMVHAEVAAIKSSEQPVGGAIMYMPWVPCLPCAEAMVKAGLDTWIGHRQMIEKTPERWIESCQEGVEYLRKNDMNIYMFDGEIGKVEHLFDGEVWRP
jgi:deoxycytidylate deaminase